MSEDTKSDQSPTSEDEDDSLRETFTKLVTTSVSTLNDWISTLNLPVQVARNAGKALNRLCSAAVDVPVAYLEGIAGEKRAVTKARNNLISENAGQIAKKMDVPPEYVHRAEIKFAEKIVREQINVDKISAVAMAELQRPASGSSTHQNSDSEKEEPIGDDFLNSFEEEARHKSSEEMQLLFGRILAGEIRIPWTFSIRTLKILGEIDQNVAVLFRRLCSLSVMMEMVDGSMLDVKVCSLGSHASQNSLAKYGLNFYHLNMLHEYGLIISDYNSSIPFINNDGIHHPFQHQGQLWGLKSLETKKYSEFRVYGVSLTHAGRELYPIVKQEPVEDYTQDLKTFFGSQNLQMVEVPAQNNT